MSPELITNVIFGVIMVAIGLCGIWIVKWSTDRLTDVAGQSRKGPYIEFLQRLLTSLRSDSGRREPPTHTSNFS